MFFLSIKDILRDLWYDTNDQESDTREAITAATWTTTKMEKKY